VTAEVRWVRAVVVIASAFFLQEAVFRNLRVDGVRPDLLLGVGIVAALVAGPEPGAMVAFVAGLAGDLFVNTPFGLSALVACVVAFLAGTVQAGVGPGQRWSIPVLTAAASLLAVVLWAVVGTVLGLPGLLHPRLLAIALVVATANATLSLPFAALMRWAVAGRPGAPPVRGYAA
jgi:rod shape-determining protein MreD